MLPDLDFANSPEEARRCQSGMGRGGRREAEKGVLSEVGAVRAKLIG